MSRHTSLPYEHLFWYYLNERESIRVRRLQGRIRSEWTNDVILAEWSFTNVKRMHDRTTALLYENIYTHHRQSHPSREALLNAMLYRYFGTYESALALGWQKTWSAEVSEEVSQLQNNRRYLGERVFTGAYIIPSGGLDKIKAICATAWSVWGTADYILNTDSWETACDRLCELWNIGQFMAKEVLLDYILITGWEPCDWQTWTPVGPGARRGACVMLHGDIAKIGKTETLSVCRHLYDNREENWPANFPALDLTDIQFALCEVGKYRKVQLGEGRPKRRFFPTNDDVTAAPSHELARCAHCRNECVRDDLGLCFVCQSTTHWARTQDGSVVSLFQQSGECPECGADAVVLYQPINLEGGPNSACGECFAHAGIGPINSGRIPQGESK